MRTQMLVLFFVLFWYIYSYHNENYERLLIFKFWALILASTFGIQYIHLFIDGDFSAVKIVKN